MHFCLLDLITDMGAGWEIWRTEEENRRMCNIPPSAGTGHSIDRDLVSEQEKDEVWMSLC